MTKGSKEGRTDLEVDPLDLHGVDDVRESLGADASLEHGHALWIVGQQGHQRDEASPERNLHSGAVEVLVHAIPASKRRRAWMHRILIVVSKARSVYIANLGGLLRSPSEGCQSLANRGQSPKWYLSQWIS
ncbi:hypothetical protein AVEN_236256-1 [Araneus ventricosus]|uniref:Uncharacterized protein n=1 Tax=Araneus ventricosus TaxID=182803 RepID=A0A4Y2N9U7_ARAVE|nr:hypothetical protein AVEN_236256-1 [Araneus ventricosus]